MQMTMTMCYEEWSIHECVRTA